MQCPTCKKHTMLEGEIAPGLSGTTCTECSGVWIKRAKYDAWLAKQPSDQPETGVVTDLRDTEPRKARICPECQHLLLPYRVDHGVSFSIDYCGACGGVWLDRNEWDAIQAKNLHDNLHNIVSPQWQAALRRAKLEERVEQTVKNMLGDDYQKVHEMRIWLRGNPLKSRVLAYLSDSEPQIL